MRTKSTIEKVMHLITFAGIVTANVSSILFGVHVMHPAFLTGSDVCFFQQNPLSAALICNAL